jgi:hypothetical protein
MSRLFPGLAISPASPLGFTLTTAPIKAVLYPGRIAATKGISVAVPMEGSGGQPLVFPNGHAVDSFLVWFNIDLPDSVPATISASGAGDIE